MSKVGANWESKLVGRRSFLGGEVVEDGGSSYFRFPASNEEEERTQSV